MTTTALMNTYGERSLTLTKGLGAWVWDDKGNRYLDGISGIAVCGLGHAHPAVTKAICDQAGTLLHASNLFNLPPQEHLANKLRELSGMTNMFFSNSGAEANEAAIKLARIYGNNKGIDLPTIVVTEKAFHGRTMATLSATGNPKVHEGFGPLVQGFARVPYNDADAVEALVKSDPNIVAVMVEPVQGEGGVHPPCPNYMNQLRDICDRHDLLLILDEIQTGNGRTGAFFAYQHANILPDVVTTAKGLGNGAPIGVCLTQGKAAILFKPGNHGSTFGGNPMACAAALATLNTIESENLVARAASLGESLMTRFKEELADCDNVIEVRGQGLIIGIELKDPGDNITAKALDNGVLILLTAGNTVRLLPPLNLSDQEAEQLVSMVVKTIKA